MIPKNEIATGRNSGPWRSFTTHPNADLHYQRNQLSPNFSFCQIWPGGAEIDGHVRSGYNQSRLTSLGEFMKPKSMPALPRWLKSPLLQIIILGTVSWLIYLHLTLTYPLNTFVAKFPLTDFGRANNWSQLTLVDFLVSIMGAFGLYLITWGIVLRHPHDRRLFWVVIAFAALFALTLLEIYPITATDIFEYVFHSRILTRYGENPLTTPPIAFKGDPFLKTVNWAVQPSPYGPLWLILTVPGSLFSGNDLLLNLQMMKRLAVVFYLGSALLVAAILQHQSPARKTAGTLLFAWNPLILFEAPENGHNDIIMMFFALLAIYFLVRRRWLWVLPALVASVLVKYITAILLIPFLVYCLLAQNGWRDRLRFLVKTGAICAVIVALLVLPFLAVPSGLIYEADFYSLLAVPTVAYFFLKGIHGDKMAKTLTLGFSSGAYILLYLLSLRWLAHPQRLRILLLLSTWLTLAYLVVGSMHFQPWFAVWPLALGIWLNHSLTRRVLLTFTMSALLSYAANFFWIWNIRAWQSPEVNVMFVLVIFAPPALVGLLSLLWDAWFGLAKNRTPLALEKV
jgi:hypothetical protein